MDKKKVKAQHSDEKLKISQDKEYEVLDYDSNQDKVKVFSDDNQVIWVSLSLFELK
jgi:hypothetical protein